MNGLIVKPQQMKSKNILIIKVPIKSRRLHSLLPICLIDRLIVQGIQGYFCWNCCLRQTAWSATFLSLAVLGGVPTLTIHPSVRAN